MMLRQITSGFLAVLVLTTTVGVTVRRHTCNAMAISRTYLVNSPLSCCKHKEKVVCHKAETIEKPCCEFTADFHFLDTDKQTGTELKNFIPAFVLLPFSFHISKFAITGFEQSVFVPESPPPLSCKERLSIIPVFRI